MKNEDVAGLNKFLNVNSHLQLTDHSRPPPPTALEKKIDQCIKKGDFEQAESLSDHLANREVVLSWLTPLVQFWIVI